ncbi:MAG: YqgE/AlgH family protein [Chthoniobacterales bacterium]
MSMELPPSDNLTGSLLVAHPSLLDPHFRRTIVYISHHDMEDGALGLILNRPTGKTVADLSRSEGPDFLLPVPVFEGGPVQKEGILIASLHWRAVSKDVSFMKIDEIQEAEQLSAPQKQNLRAFLGYSGWSKGQIESEIQQKAWIVMKPEKNSIMSGTTDETWKKIMRSLGPIYHLLSESPDDPAMN